MVIDETARPDTTDMYAIHRTFTRNLADAPALIQSARDDHRLELIRNFYDNGLGGLHAHHEAEDVLLYPLLEERCPAEIPTIRRILAQHAELNPTLAHAKDSLKSWSLADAATGEQLTAAMIAVRDQLDKHLSDEERNILPLAADHMSVEEWGAIAAHAIRNYPGDKIWLAFGLVRENMTQDQRDQMLANMPPPALKMWTEMGEESFKSLITELRAPLESHNA